MALKQAYQSYFYLSLCFFLLCDTAVSEVYKYKNEAGHWIFSDVKPRQKVEIEKIRFKHKKKSVIKPRVSIQQIEGRYVVAAKNPFYAPIEIGLTSVDSANMFHKQVIPALSTLTLINSEKKIAPFRYQWVMGDPAAKHATHYYQFPVVSKKRFKITQAFNGPYSHTDEPNQFAVDVAMPVGTYIGASREGIVTQVKDDYHMAGTTAFFRDKANIVKVLHEDGTFAIYAHLLQGSALVKTGDRVSAGDKLARSGSSGFSTGPHLHFVIRKNSGLKTTSLRFFFADATGAPYTPKEGMRIYGTREP